MSPVGQGKGRHIVVADNLYTAILALAVGVVLATAVFVSYKCYSRYGTIFKSPQQSYSRTWMR